MSFLGWIKDLVFGENGFDQEKNDATVEEIKKEAKDYWFIQERADGNTKAFFSNLKHEIKHEE